MFYIQMLIKIRCSGKNSGNDASRLSSLLRDRFQHHDSIKSLLLHIQVECQEQDWFVICSVNPKRLGEWFLVEWGVHRWERCRALIIVGKQTAKLGHEEEA
jgi:hypothetical protein